MRNNLIKFTQGHEDHIWLFIGARTQASIDDERVIGLLKTYLSCPFTLSKDSDGKPWINSAGSPLYISIAHSGSFLAVALSAQQEMGLDIEYLSERPYRKKISDRYFLPSEPKAGLLDFYRSWTAREAFIKIIGGRLFKRLGQIKLKLEADKCLIGLDKLTHQVIFHQHQDYLLALCRAEDRAALIRISDTETLTIFGNRTAR